LDSQYAVAVVDDDEAVLASLEFLISVAGHRVKAYPSAQAFLDDELSIARCLIVDQHMPYMTGLELIRQLRINGNKIPAMLITGAASPIIRKQATELGIEKVLDKPPSEEDLFSFIGTNS